jgi:hypothetical protein
MSSRIDEVAVTQQQSTPPPHCSLTVCQVVDDACPVRRRNCMRLQPTGDELSFCCVVSRGPQQTSDGRTKPSLGALTQCHSNVAVLRAARLCSTRMVDHKAAAIGAGAAETLGRVCPPSSAPVHTSAHASSWRGP